MNDFTATLAEFRAGRCEFAELEAAFGRLVAASPAEIDAAMALVDAHYRAGHFPTQLYADFPLPKLHLVKAICLYGFAASLALAILATIIARFFRGRTS